VDDDYGLSTFRTHEQATQGKGGKFQKLDLSLIRKLGFIGISRPDGHVAIRPRTEDEMKEWVKSKGTDNIDQYWRRQQE
jgi:hypothetical protein